MGIKQLGFGKNELIKAKKCAKHDCFLAQMEAAVHLKLIINLIESLYYKTSKSLPGVLTTWVPAAGPFTAAVVRSQRSGNGGCPDQFGNVGLLCRHRPEHRSDPGGVHDPGVSASAGREGYRRARL